MATKSGPEWYEWQGDTEHFVLYRHKEWYPLDGTVQLQDAFLHFIEEIHTMMCHDFPKFQIQKGQKIEVRIRPGSAICNSPYRISLPYAYGMTALHELLHAAFRRAKLFEGQDTYESVMVDDFVEHKAMKHFYFRKIQWKYFKKHPIKFFFWFNDVYLTKKLDKQYDYREWMVVI